jgi:hypothetical protein
LIEPAVVLPRGRANVDAILSKAGSSALDRGAVEWLLSTQDDEGAVHGDLPEDATPAELAAADAYAVLRACREGKINLPGMPWSLLAGRLNDQRCPCCGALMTEKMVDLLLHQAEPEAF